MVDTKQLTAMLKQLGWGSGFRLPISNDENRKLEQMLELKQSKLVNLSLELQEVTLAVENSESFMKNLSSKMRHAKDVETAKRGQMEKERQFLALAERDRAKTVDEARTMEKRLKAIKERNAALQDNVMRRKDALGELVDIINFDKKAISAYEDKFKKEDAYMKLIEDFADTDNEKLKKCKDDYQRMGEKVVTSRVRLDQTIAETSIMDGELEELAKRFRKAHSERNQFIVNWKRTLDVLEDRDEEITNMSNIYQQVSLEMKKKLGMLERQEAFYNNIQVQSKCYENELNRIERSMDILHRRKKEAETINNEYSDSLSDVVGYINLTDKDIRKMQNQIKNMHDDTGQWREKIVRLKEDLESLKAKYDVVSMEHLTAAEQTKQLQEFLDKEERKSESLAKELAKQIEWKSQREKQTKDISRQVMLTDSDARNLKAAIARARKQCMHTADMLFKTNGIAYRLDLKVMHLVFKVNGLENPASLYSKEDYAHTQKQIGKLKECVEEQLHIQNQVKSQISQCDHVIFTCQKELSKEVEQNRNFETKMHKLETEIKSIVKEDEAFLEKIRELGVGNSLLNVQLHRMIQSIKSYESKMLDLEQHRVTIQMAAKERKADIEVYTSLMLGKKRALQDETQKLKLKCFEVSNDLQARKRKYEMVMGQMWKGDGDQADKEAESSSEGGNRSEAYFIIKLAQEREHYRQEGDKWDERVKEAEKVVEGLQNTLALMMGTNEAFKDSLKPATDNTVEGKGLRELKQKELDSARKLKFVKDEREKCALKLKHLQSKLDELVSFKADYEHQILEKRYELQGLIMEINGQKEKIQRATQQANKLVRELSKLESLDAELLQTDLRLRITKEKFEYAVLTLEKMLQTNPILIGDTIEFLHVKGMEGLAKRITHKLISPSIASTPNHSGRSTPFSSRSLADRKDSKTSIGSIGTSVGTRSFIGKGKSSQSLLARRSTQKSVVFEELTSAPTTKRMLENINRGLEARKSRSIGSISGVIAPRQTPHATESGVGAGGGISFGELRKALQDAVDEQKRSLVEADEEQDGSDGSGRSSMDSDNASDGSRTEKNKRSYQSGESERDVIELVDNKEKFAEAARQDKT